MGANTIVFAPMEDWLWVITEVSVASRGSAADFLPFECRLPIPFDYAALRALVLTTRRAGWPFAAALSNRNWLTSS